MLNTLVVTKKKGDQLNPANQREAVTFGRESVGLAADSYFILTPLLFKREWKGVRAGNFLNLAKMEGLVRSQRCRRTFKHRDGDTAVISNVCVAITKVLDAHFISTHLHHGPT